jgi:NADH dehydrogenase FAD-containing subunit
MHPYALLYFPFCYACYIVFALWRLFFMLYRFLYYCYIMMMIKVPPWELRKRVVIVGGGFSGSYAAQCLEEFFHVTLIDTKDYFEFTPSVLRTIVEPTHIRKIQVMHNHYLKSATVLQKEVIRIEPHCVVLDDRKESFDYLIICTGTSYTQPFKETRVIASARANTLRESFYTLRKVKHILIIGGGLVGVEMAAEIISHFKGKEVTLVHSQSNLIKRFPPRAIRYTEEFLRSRGVRIVLNERIVGHRGQTFITDQNTEVHAEVAFLCTGNQPNSGFLREWFPDSINDSGYVRTNDHLQLMGGVIYPHIFVAGDAIEVREEKLAQAAESMASVVVNNIFCMERGKILEKYKSPSSRPVLISLGKYHGIFVYGGWTITGPLPALLKEAVEWKTLVRYW